MQQLFILQHVQIDKIHSSLSMFERRMIVQQKILEQVHIEHCFVYELLLFFFFKKECHDSINMLPMLI
jgi:hypothetical protein